ncbi:MAG: hypothetical protein ACK4E8_09495 [Lacibacter sp.]|jgi:hypothetical protein
MLHRTIFFVGNTCRLLGILAFIATCYFWFGTANLHAFLICKRLTILFFSTSLLLWLLQLLLQRRR